MVYDAARPFVISADIRKLGEVLSAGTAIRDADGAHREGSVT